MNVFHELDENSKPVPCGAFAGARGVTANEVSGACVSTIFTGYDMGFGDGLPVLWETMIFGGRHHRYTERYTSLEDALIGHAQAVALVEAEQEETR